jgi:hypothetical protein
MATFEQFLAMDAEIIDEQRNAILKSNTYDLRRALVLAMWTVDNLSDEDLDGCDIIARLKEVVADALTDARL